LRPWKTQIRAIDTNTDRGVVGDLNVTDQPFYVKKRRINVELDTNKACP